MTNRKTKDTIEVTNAIFHNTSAGRAVFSKKFNFIYDNETGAAVTYGETAGDTPNYDPIGPQEYVIETEDFEFEKFKNMFNMFAVVKEIKEDGSLANYSNSSSGDIDKAIDEVGKLAAKISYSGQCQTHDCVQQHKTGDCWGMSDYIACELKSRGVETKIKQYATAYSDRHRSVLYKDKNGKWTRFPYREYNVSMLFRDTDGVNHGSDVNSTC